MGDDGSQVSFGRDERLPKCIVVMVAKSVNVLKTTEWDVLSK